MSKYKLEINVSMIYESGILRKEVVDVVDDMYYTDEEAEEMLKDKEKIRELAFQWSDEHIFVEARKLEESEVQEL